MAKRHTFSGESESLNGLLDTMTNVIGVLILMLLASFLTVRQVVRTVEQKDAVLAKSRSDQPSQLNKAAAQLEATLTRLRSEAALVARSVPPEFPIPTVKAAPSLASIASGTSRLNPEALQRELLASQRRLAILQEEIIERDLELQQLRRSATTDSREAPPRPKKRIATVPDPVSPAKGAVGRIIVCRYGRVQTYPEVLMVAEFERRFSSVSKGIHGTLSPIERYQTIATHFDNNFCGVEGFRWRLRVAYNDGAATGQPAVELLARVEWVSKKSGETLEQIEQPASAYHRLLGASSTQTNYLKFLVWPESFSEYAVAREVADGRGFASGWLPQHETSMEKSVAKTALATEPMPRPTEIRPMARRRGPSLGEMSGAGQVSGPTFGGGSGGGNATSVGGRGDRVD